MLARHLNWHSTNCQSRTAILATDIHDRDETRLRFPRDTPIEPVHASGGKQSSLSRAVCELISAS